MAPSRSAGKFGSIRGDLPFLKDRIDFWLTRVPSLYLAVERRREWTNWDKRVYLSFIRKGDVVVDIGANVGAHTVFFSHLVGPHGRVISFEPVAENLFALRALIAKRARFDNITVIDAALAAPDFAGGEAEIVAPVHDLTQASLRAHRAGSWEVDSDMRRFPCRIARGDEEPELRSLDRIGFMKIDVEGGELDAMKGSEQSISRHCPLLYCEVYEKWTRSFGYAPNDLIMYVASLGYVGARVISRGSVYPLKLKSAAPDAWFETSSDVLFFHKSHEKAVRRFDRRYGVNGL